ncbi:MAG: hypothetical protein ACI4GZ_02360 [Ruminococcus sp.]
MKNTRLTKLPVIFIILLLVAVIGTVAVSAETTPQETYAIESFVEETTEYAETTEAPQESTDAPEDTTASGETSASAETSTKATEPKVTYKEPLPEVASEDIEIPSAVVDSKEENEPNLFWGFVAWICIGVGSAAILAVLLTTKTKAYRSGGKKRYSTGDKISGKKRLLNDKYYDNKKR